MFTIELDITDHNKASTIEELRRAKLKLRPLHFRRLPYACQLTGSADALARWCFANGYTELQILKDGTGHAL